MRKMQSSRWWRFIFFCIWIMSYIVVSYGRRAFILNQIMNVVNSHENLWLCMYFSTKTSGYYLVNKMISLVVHLLRHKYFTLLLGQYIFMFPKFCSIRLILLVSFSTSCCGNMFSKSCKLHLLNFPQFQNLAVKSKTRRKHFDVERNLPNMQVESH